MTTPLTRPQPAPTSSAVTTMTIQCVSSAICWVASVVAQTEDSATIAPTDRSMPPPMITKVMPMLTTPITEASRRMVSTLSKSANRSPAVMTPTMHSSTSATTRPRLRPSGPPSRPAAPPRPDRGAEAPPEEPPARAVVVVVPLMPHLPARFRSPSAPRSFLAAMLRRPSSRHLSLSCGGVRRRSLHHEVEHPVLVEFVGRGAADHDTVGDHQHAVGQSEHLRDLAGDHDHGDPAVGQRADQPVDLRAGTDVDPSGRFVQQQHPAVPQQPAGQHDLLLVAAGQRADLAVDVDRPQVQCLRLLAGRALLGAPGQEATPGEPGHGGEGDVPVDRLAEQQALALALLPRQPHPPGDPGGAVARARPAARPPPPARPRAPGAGGGP